MPTVTTEVATPERWNDAQAALAGGGDGRSCQCAWWTLTNAEYNSTTIDERRERLRHEIANTPSPGVLAYVDGQPAGWARVSPRTVQARLPRTRNIATATQEPFDDPTVWALTCFSVRKEHRGHGITGALLAAAIDHARASGARLIEAYPVDTGGGKHPSNDLYSGTLPTFLAAGFTQVGLRKPGRPIVTLKLTA